MSGLQVMLQHCSRINEVILNFVARADELGILKPGDLPYELLLKIKGQSD